MHCKARAEPTEAREPGSRYRRLELKAEVTNQMRARPRIKSADPPTSTLAAFDRIGLADLGTAGLMRRKDTKFMFTPGVLSELLAGLEREYEVLAVGGEPVQEYLTLYFDTARFDLFAAHHRGLGERVKVRERQYLSTGQHFLEVKLRSIKGVTTKTRAESSAWDEALDVDTLPVREALLSSERIRRLAGSCLIPTLWNRYRRLTLVRKDRLERVTIDLGLSYAAEDRTYASERVVIAEVKQAKVDLSSPFMLRMRGAGLRPQSFSKYCMGVALLRPELKHNRFKPTLRDLRFLDGGVRHVA